MGNLVCGCFYPSDKNRQTTGISGLSTSITVENAYYEEVQQAKNLFGKKHIYSSLISLSFTAQNLPRKVQENGVKLELFAALYQSNQKEFNQGEKIQGDLPFDEEKNKNLLISQTENIGYTENPAFKTPLNIRYDFEKLQYLKVVLILKEKVVAKEATGGDAAGKQIEVTEFTQIGQLTFILSELLLLENQKILQKIEKKALQSESPMLELQATEKTKLSSNIELLFHAKNLSSKDGLDSLSPFLLISQRDESNQWVPIYRTEVRIDQDEAHWKVIQMSLGQFNQGDVTRPIKLDVNNWHENGRHESIGSLITDTRDLLEKYENPSAMHLKNASNLLSGYIFVRRCEINARPSFLEYFQAGVKLNLMIGIDYTASNGEISSSNSLHYFDENNVNQYEEIICGFGDVLEPYLGGQEIRVWGFGGKTAHAGNGDSEVQVQQDFEVGVGCQDIDDVINAYHQSLEEVALSGPGILTPIIQKAIQVAEKADENQVYNVLLIITDGEVNHDSKFLESMIEASQQALSIILIGVGDERFDGMAVLDSSNQKHLAVNGITATRDILQFEKFEDYRNEKSVLFEKVLEQIPRQFMEFMKNKSGVVNIQNPLTSQEPVSMRPLRSYSLADRQNN